MPTKTKLQLLVQFAAVVQVLLSFAVATVQAADCSTVTCFNGGTCNNHTDSPDCICPLPYIAPDCESAADYCNTLQPDKNITELPVCLNDGNCTMTYTDPYFNCSCTAEFTGTRCETNTTEMDYTMDSTFCLFDCDIGLTTTSKIVIAVCIPSVVVIIVCVVIYLRMDRNKSAVISEAEDDTKSKLQIKKLGSGCSSS